MKALLGFALSLAACAATDPCAGHAGTCLGIEVTGAEGAEQLDTLYFEVTYPDGDATKTIRAKTSDTPAKLVSLPLTSAVYLEPGVIGKSTVVISGLADGRVVAHAEAIVDVESGQHYDITTGLDAPPDGGVAPCPAGSLFCDDFESDGTPADPDWSRWTHKGPFIITNAEGGDPATDSIDLGLDDHEVYRGAYAMEASQSGGGFGELAFAPASAIQSGVVGVRAYIYTSAPLADLTAPIAIYLDNGPSFLLGIGASRKDGGDSGFWQLTHLTDTIYTGIVAPSDRWLCVEAVLDLDHHTITMFATDAFAPDRNAQPIASAGDVPVDPLSEIDFGITISPGSVTQAIWFDDVVVGPNRIGCE